MATILGQFDAAINSNPMLSGVQKLNYLRAQLQGDAATVVPSYHC